MEKRLADRRVGYDKVSKKISRWQAVVKRNREADQLVFPLGADERKPGSPLPAVGGAGDGLARAGVLKMQMFFSCCRRASIAQE